MTIEKDLVKEGIKVIIKKLGEIEERIAWVQCPLCKEEWTKLMWCEYYVSGPTTDRREICVGCAEHLENFHLVVATAPLDKPFDNWPDNWMEMKNVEHSQGQRIVIKTRLPGKEGEIHHWLLYRDGQRVVLYDRKEGKLLMSYPHTFALWHGIRHRIKEWSVGAGKAERVVKEAWSAELL